MWKRACRATVALLASAHLAACATGVGSGATTSAIGETPTPGASPKPVRIAMLLPLNGLDQSAVIAKGMKQAGEMALFDLDNPYVQLLVKNDNGTSDGARAAAAEAISEGAEIIVGPLTSQATAGAASVARPANVPILSFSNDRNVAGNGVYLMSFLADQEVERIVSFAASRGKRNFAALLPNDGYGRIVEPAFRSAVMRAGGRVAAIEMYDLEANAMLPPAKRMLDTIKQSDDTGAPIDTLMIAGGPTVLPRITPLITYAGIDPNRVKLIGTGAWDYPNIGGNAALVGGWYPGPDPRGWQDFSRKFIKSYGTSPPRLASLAYDAVSVAVTLSSNPPGQRYTAENITRMAGFNGVDGMVRFGANGVPERGLAVLEVQTFGANLLDPAPNAFEGPTKVSVAPAQ